MKQQITVNGVNYTIEYKTVSIGDTIFDLSSRTLYIASIMDADDLQWVVV